MIFMMSGKVKNFFNGHPKLTFVLVTGAGFITAVIVSILILRRLFDSIDKYRTDPHGIVAGYAILFCFFGSTFFGLITGGAWFLFFRAKMKTLP